MNKLQEEAKALAVRLGPYYDAVAEELLAGVTPAVALKNAGYYEAVTNEVLNSVTVAGAFGTRGTAYGIATEQWREWYLNSSHLGGALSGNVRSSSALSSIQGVVRKGLKIENSVNALADTIQRSKDTLTDTKLPKALNRLVNEARTAKAITPQLKKEIAQAERYVQSLSGGPARGSKQLKTAYAQLVNSAKSGKLKEEYVTKATNRQLRYVNERIARTEMANAYELTRRRAYDEDPAVTHFEWELSPEHPLYDICDYYADADLYGKGAGVYPIDSGVTCPAHVQCLCTTFPVLHEETKGRYSTERSQEYIKGLPEKDRKRLIGAKTPTSQGTKEINKKHADPRNNTRAMMPKSLLKEG